jgi:microcystin-dependent protein
MGDQFISEIKIVSFNFPPKGWAFCNGQTLPIAQNQALFSLIGTMYGGNGQTTFALPNLQGRVPLHMGAGFFEGETGGEDSHTLIAAEMPQHLHQLNASPADGSLIIPGTGLLARSPANPYKDPGTLAPMNAAALATAGASQPHTNEQPYLVLNFVIALVGVFPSRN